MVSLDGYEYLVPRKADGQVMTMERASCSMPGMLALAAHHLGDREAFGVAEELAETCFRLYNSQESGLGADQVSIPDMQPTPGAARHSLNSQLTETLLILWRLTKNSRYRQWGYQIALSIETYCKSAYGYCALEDVNGLGKADKQDGGFLASTVKYLFLLFGPDSVLPLDRWVFNGAGHPFPILP